MKRASRTTNKSRSKAQEHLRETRKEAQAQLLPSQLQGYLTIQTLQPKLLRKNSVLSTMIAMVLLTQITILSSNLSRDSPMNWIMEQFTRVSGPKRALDMARVSRSGRTAASMRATGRMTWPTAEAVLSIPMEMSTKENGLMIRLMDAVPMFTWTELNILASGEKTSSTVSVLRHGLTVPSMKATTSMVKSMELVPLSGLTARCTSENFIITTFMEKECTLGQTVASMKESGAITKCTAKERSPGLMAESMSANM